MAPTAPIVLALFRQATSSSPDEQSMLQMQMQMPIQHSDGSECRCPAYFKGECEKSSFQGCMWSEVGSNHGCICDPNFVPTPPLFTDPDNGYDGPDPVPTPAPTQAPTTQTPTTQAPTTQDPTTQGPVTTPAPVVTPQDLMVCQPDGPDGDEVAPALTTECMSEADYNSIESKITKIMQDLDEECNEVNCPQADWAGCVLRMAGHDFMDFKLEQGGSDGCTDMEDPDNKGLDPCLAVGEHGFSLKDDVYKDFCTRISLADFLVVSAEAVMTVLRNRVDEGKAEQLRLDFHDRFHFGRTTVTGDACASLLANKDAGRLPNPEHGCPAVREVFMDNLGLSEAGSAALMGVHTIGRARATNSGYEGFWSDPENSRLFNNNYYVSMLAKGWGPVEMTPVKHQWNRIDHGTTVGDDNQAHLEMMLNTDLCLVYDADDSGTELNAADHACCAWIDSFVIGGEDSGEHTGAIANNGDLFCGVNCATTDELQGKCNGGLDERALCCAAGGGRQASDCGDPREPSGLAISAVKDFAASDTAWITEFVAAWAKVTEAGNIVETEDSPCPAGHEKCLKQLSATCPAA